MLEACVDRGTKVPHNAFGSNDSDDTKEVFHRTGVQGHSPEVHKALTAN